MPNALPRSFWSVKVVASSDSAAGASIAPKAPWQARAVNSIGKSTEAPPTADATAKPARPVMNIARRPTRSASRPPNRSRLPKDIEYHHELRDRDDDKDQPAPRIGLSWSHRCGDACLGHSGHQSGGFHSAYWVSITRSGDISSGQGTLLVMTANAEAAARDGAAERPLRRDAERNRQRILAAAAEVFSECGLDATLDEVARAAGVGVGTVYRRFPDKESLVQELFRDRIDGLVAVAEHSCTAADPWQGLVSYLEFAVSAMAADLGLRQMMTFATYGRDHVCYARERMRPVISRLVQRAQASGDLRDDLEPTDVKLIVFMLASVAEYAATVRPDIWRRYLALLLDGCLLYTSDAADDLLCVDLGGRRIIKKKKKK